MSALINRTCSGFPISRSLCLALSAVALSCPLAAAAATHHAMAARGRAVATVKHAGPAAPSGRKVASSTLPVKAHPTGSRATSRLVSAKRSGARAGKTRAVVPVPIPIERQGAPSALDIAREELRSAGVKHPAVQAEPVHKNAAATRQPEPAADQATQDRVHAWYKARVGPDPGSKTDAPSKTPVTADLSTEPHKATAADFQRALDLQRKAAVAAQKEAQSHTTADDDAAAAAETHIPSTAPTARVSAPFIHGDLMAAARAADATPPAAQPDLAPDSAAAITAKLSQPKPVVITRDPAPAIAAIKSAAKKPEIDPATAQALSEEALTSDADPAAVAKSAPLLAAKAGAPMKRAATLDDDEDEAGPTVKVTLYDGGGRLLMLPPMKGTHEILVHQNQMAVSDGLDRIQDDNQLREMRRGKLLTALPDTDAITVDSRLPANRRFARPWSVRFLHDMARAHYARFHTPLIVTSAARTVDFQRRLVRINGNAAPPTGDIASPHLYGQAVDVAKHGMNLTEIAWMRAYLTPVESSGKIDVEEEFQQSCFHISVYRRYLGLPARKGTPAPATLPQRQLQQAKVTVPAGSKRRRRLSALLAAGVR